MVGTLDQTSAQHQLVQGETRELTKFTEGLFCVVARLVDRLRCPLWAKSGHSAIHSITSSAATNKLGGMVNPSVLAVFKLITNSNLADWTTGRSPAFSPLRMRPA